MIVDISSAVFIKHFPVCIMNVHVVCIMNVHVCIMNVHVLCIMNVRYIIA